MKKTRRSVCPVACALDLMGDKWTLLVVRDLACGKRHFNDFCRSPEKIATNILADRLERLVANDLAEKYASDDPPNRDCYRLTAKGKSLGPVLTAVSEWGLSNIQGTKAVLKPTFE
jgi:DNA-binding HxlR family transcriptional regulator